ncbi:hypothetical protein [Virgisporangium ochraceum]|uniref:Uncharacterized protein n=1 Tax=Virgisporangium ochraceum TaxID=65505 RepID=A0A8J3ZYY8_9ACTN|nr:hypothetical protein [Virgisporangium ochraceum]GIJ72749.1 hypothetical protein Voc01_076660 [Virgisporangium ochraceum]
MTYRSGTGAEVSSSLDRVVVDEVVAGLPVREFRWYKVVRDMVGPMRLRSMAVCASLAAVFACGSAGPPDRSPPVADPSSPVLAPKVPARVAQVPAVRSKQTGSLRLLPSVAGVLIVATYFGGGCSKGCEPIERSGTAAWWCAGPPCKITSRPAPMPDRDPWNVDDGRNVVYVQPSSGYDQSVIDLARCDPIGCRAAESVTAALAGRTLLMAAVDGTDLLMLHKTSKKSSLDPPTPEEHDLWLARCPIVSCLAGWTSHRIATVPYLRSYDVALGVRDGRPVVAYREDRPDRTTLLLCADRACVSTPRAVKVDGMGMSHRMSMRVLPSGRIAMLAGSTLMTCDDPACTTASVVTLPKGRARAVDDTDFTVDAAGRPLIVTNDSNGELLLRTCAEESCRSSSSVVVGLRVLGDARPGVAVDAAGNPLIAVLARNTLTVVACETRDCR